MKLIFLCLLATVTCALVLSGCGGSSSSSYAPPAASAQGVKVRIADGAPVLEALINGVPEDIGAAYLQVDGSTVISSFAYGGLSPFLNMSAGVHSLRALDELGYSVGPLKTTSLSPGGRYTLILVGSYPNYQVLTFEEPASAKGTQLSLYEASPSVPKAAFGSFRASSYSDLRQLGSAAFGNVATVNLGASVSNFGGFAAATSCPKPSPPNCLTLAQIDAFDSHNVLPFHSATRLSLFLFDPKAGSGGGPVFGSLDK